MSPTDPPLPPSPDEPQEEPQWAGVGSGEPQVPPAPADGVPGDDVPGDDAPGDDVPGDDVPGDDPVGDAVAGDDVLGAEPAAAQPTGVIPVTGDDLTDLLPPTGDEPTEVFPPTGAEPTDVLGAAMASDGTGEYTREHRRRVSHRRYVIRRIGVTVAVLAVIGGGVFALITVLGDNDDGAGGGSDSTLPATTEALSAPSTSTRPTTTAASPSTTDAEAVATTVPRTTDAVQRTTTTPAAQPTDPPAETDPPSATGSATESSPPGTVVYDLDSEADCEIGQALRRGNSGPQVECLQERLNQVTVGGTAAAVDGAFGAQTEAAVRAFQEANGLGVDGIVGPATGELLGIWAG